MTSGMSSASWQPAPRAVPTTMIYFLASRHPMIRIAFAGSVWIDAMRQSYNHFDSSSHLRESAGGHGMTETVLRRGCVSQKTYVLPLDGEQIGQIDCFLHWI